MKTFDRRDFLKLMGMAGLTAAFPWPLRPAQAQSLDPYDGPLFVTVAAAGGWDPTSFCDPKMNVPGERPINHWSNTQDTQTIAGSPIMYAPFANNAEFFQRFYPHMLVVNGVNTETNSHDVGIRHNWSGRIPAGYPSFSAIAASIYGRDLPLPYLTNAGYRETAGLVPYTEVAGARDLQDLVNVNRVAGSDRLYRPEDEMSLIEQYQSDRLDTLAARTDLLPRERQALTNLALARASRSQLQALALSLPSQMVGGNDKDGLSNGLLQQAQLALTCCSAGLTVACDLEIGGFDTHGNHDVEQRNALMRLTNGIMYLWDTAESLGLADRLTVLVASDFGRTPYYNDGNGKDHWPTSSALLIQQNAPWANRVVGASDEGHNALLIDPQTLMPAAAASGVSVTPGHVHQTFRTIAGVASHATARKFPFDVPSVDLLA
jgi:Protein of unknown function (DUF1501)